jgi:inorganic phosphate transporter, PiT family
MSALLIFAMGLLSLANGANDNFKGVATLWGAGLTSYRRAIAWATGFTFLGSLTAIWFGGAVASRFSGAKLIDSPIVGHFPFLAAVALGAGATVLLAARLGLPISTTHSILGALVGAGVTAVGFSHVRFAALGKGVILPLLFSPFVALVLTVGIQLVITRQKWHAGKGDCICVDEPKTLKLAAINFPMASVVAAPPFMRWAPATECETGAEIARLSLADGVHWFSGATISFARGLNDTPKIVATLLAAAAVSVELNYFFVGLAIAGGGALGAIRVAQTMSRKITPMSTPEAVVANLVAAALVILASPLGLPVSTTHVTSGSIFGIGLLRRQEADWSKVRAIVLSWAATLPLGALLGLVIYRFLLMWWS